MPFARGRLRPPGSAPASGEDVIRLAEIGHAVVDQILSGRLDEPVDYRPETDEWVVLLDGRATLDIGDERLVLEAGDWVLLPARIPHRLVETEPGTNWLTVTGVPTLSGPGRTG